MQPLRSYFTQVPLGQLHKEIKENIGKGSLGKQAAHSVGLGRSIGIDLDDGESWRLNATLKGIEIDENVDSAKVVISTSTEAWMDLVSEAWSIMGLVIQNRVTLEKGSFSHVAAWEAPLQALYNKRPIFREDNIQKRFKHEFNLDDSPLEMAKSLRNLGFIIVREVFSPEEIEAMSKEVEARRITANPEDKRSWWATDKDGKEHCCRVTYMNHGSKRFTDLAYDRRLSVLAQLADEELYPTPNHGDGVSVVIKVPEINEGLSDLPWHRDCGMGGHPLICPGLNIGVQLDVANKKSGQLIFLPGSNEFAGGVDIASKTTESIGVEAEPGDVTVHYGHTLHIAPPPDQSSQNRRTVYVSFHKKSYIEALPEGKGYNDVLFSHGDGRVRNPQERIETN